MQAGISEKERKLIDRMILQGKQVFETREAANAAGLTGQQANLVLARLAKKGWLQRLKSGVYRVVPLGSDSADPVPEDAMAIAMDLFSPCYIGGWTSAGYWDLTEQIFNTTAVFTVQPERASEHKIAGLNFRTTHILPEHLFGTINIWPGNKKVTIADMHRTIIDIFKNPEMGAGGRSMIDIFRSYTAKKEASPDLLWQYAQQLSNGAVFKRLGILSEIIWKTSQSETEKIRANCKSGIILLDPRGPVSGPVNSRWGVRLNLPISDLA
jgi:predicted transcriptional regulator of viral defense system